MTKYDFNSFLDRMKLKARKKKRQHHYANANDRQEYYIFEKDEDTNPFLHNDTHLAIARIKTYRKLKILKKVRNPLML